MKKNIAVFFFLVIAAFGVYRLNSARTIQLFGEIYARVETDQKVVALTLDDGPNEKIDTVLSILKKHNVKATFFPIGELMKKDLSPIQKIVEDGHELGNHSYTHRKLSLRSYQTIRQEIEPTDKLLREAGHLGDIHFRPPYGIKFFMLPLYLKQNNRKTITWEVAPEGNSALNMDAEKLAQFVIKQTKNGSIILLHPMNKGREASLQSLEPIILGLKAKGFRFKTVSELLNEEEN